METQNWGLGRRFSYWIRQSLGCTAGPGLRVHDRGGFGRRAQLLNELHSCFRQDIWWVKHGYTLIPYLSVWYTIVSGIPYSFGDEPPAIQKYPSYYRMSCSHSLAEHHQAEWGCLLGVASTRIILTCSPIAGLAGRERWAMLSTLSESMLVEKWMGSMDCWHVNRSLPFFSTCYCLIVVFGLAFPCFYP